MIVLDWTKPWTFIDHLELWLSWVTKWTKGDGSRELEVVRDEGRERCKVSFVAARVGLTILDSAIALAALHGALCRSRAADDHGCTRNRYFASLGTRNINS